MFLRATRERNPEILSTAAALHREREIPADCFVIDIDRVVANARTMAESAEAGGLSLYAMTKQAGRNPFLALAALAGGIAAAVAVDVPEACVLNLHKVPIGHLGHLVQVPGGDLCGVLAMQPQVVTVFSLEAARRLSLAAAQRSMVQPILIRILQEGDFVYRGQEGGFTLAELPAAVSELRRLAGVRLTGVTAFPCLLFDYEAGEVEETPNFHSLLRAADMLRELGVEVTQVNAPSVTCAATIPLLATRGATHGEPGSALTGSTPLHAVSRQPETPAVVYVSEVMTVQGSRAYCLGGGFYARSRVSQALIGDPAADPLLAAVDPLPAESIDYYGTLDLPPGADVHLGDTVLFAFRSQVFVSRSRVAAVAGIASGNPRVLGICDAAGNLLGEDLLPLGSTQARDRVAAAWQSYALAHKVPRQNLPVSVRAKGPGDPG